MALESLGPRCLVRSGPQVLQLLKSGEKINAIKLAHQLTGVGLKECMDYCESLEEQLTKSQSGQMSGHTGYCGFSASPFIPIQSGDFLNVRSRVAETDKEPVAVTAEISSADLLRSPLAIEVAVKRSTQQLGWLVFVPVIIIALLVLQHTVPIRLLGS
jgi:hypothetical protein